MGPLLPSDLSWIQDSLLGPLAVQNGCTPVVHKLDNSYPPSNNGSGQGGPPKATVPTRSCQLPSLLEAR